MARASAPVSTSSSIFPGMWVTKNVVIRECIGVGGMGSVWRAEHMPLGIEVAVKFISPELLDDASAYERFRREARAAARIHSPHVVQVLDHGTTDDSIAYIVMERLEGETLSARLKRKQRLTIQEAEWIVEDVCRGLGSAHRLDIVHRDIKPANLFLAQQDGRTLVKLLDFGVSHTIARDTRLTQTGTIIGSPKYMSPEQLLEPSHVDARADLWGLAAVTYRVLTGRMPFAGDNVATIAVALNRGEHIAASVINPELPTAIDRWFYKAFERDIDDRFESAEQMAQLFRHLLRGDQDDEPETVSLHINMADTEGELSTLIKRPKRPKGPASAWRHTQLMPSVEGDGIHSEVTHNRLDDAETEDNMPTHRVSRSKVPLLLNNIPPPPPPPSSPGTPSSAASTPSIQVPSSSSETTRVIPDRRQRQREQPPPNQAPEIISSQPPRAKRGPMLLAEQRRQRRQLATFVVLGIIVLVLFLALFFALTS